MAPDKDRGLTDRTASRASGDTPIKFQESWQSVGFRVKNENEIKGKKFAGGKQSHSQQQAGSWLQMEVKFNSLALKFSRSMNLYGLPQDVGLLLVGEQRTATSRTRLKSARLFLTKLLCLSLVLCANLTAVYVLVAHVLWEYRILEAKSLQHQTAATKGWSVLKEFLENLRRHLTRLFSLALAITWHLSWRKLERLFVDCHHYHGLFYTSFGDCVAAKKANNDAAGDKFRGDMVNCSSFLAVTTTDVSRAEKQDKELQARVIRKRDFDKRNGDYLYRSSRRLYWTVRRRVYLAFWLPILHYIFNILSVSIFPSSSKRSARAAAAVAAAASLQPNGVLGNLTGISAATKTSTSSLNHLIGLALDNFDSFHLAIHTAFHPLDHQLLKGSGTLSQSAQQIRWNSSNQTANLTMPPPPSVVSARHSAIYCLLELFVYSMYFNGPRIICATCLSLVLHLHHQCLLAFNKRLARLIRRPNARPLGSKHLICLLKQYDLIVMMNERIEQTFKWSIVLWFSLMCISCLMHIFSFTESTSAYVVSNFAQAAAAAASAGNALNTSNGSAAGLARVANKLSSIGNSSNGTNWTHTALAAFSQPPPSTSIAVMFIRLASVFFVCYPPCLIWSEAFKMETTSARCEQLIWRLARRRNDPLAQSIEPNLFEPIYLNAGGYFHVNKKSMCSFLGAIVTFSVMFIARVSYQDDSNQEDESNSSDAVDLDLQQPDGGGNVNDEGEGEHVDNNSGDSVSAKQEDEISRRRLAVAQQSATGRGAGSEVADGGSGQQLLLSKENQRRKYHKRLLKEPMTKSRWRQRHQQQHETATGTSGNGSGSGDTNVGSTSSQTSGALLVGVEAPKLEEKYEAFVRENERLVELANGRKLRILNQAEVCDIELFAVASTAARNEQHNQRQPPFIVSWIDRVSGEATLEAQSGHSIDCERQRNYTFMMRALGCNGLSSNDALISISVIDANEFSPEFERSTYSATVELDAPETQVLSQQQQQQQQDASGSRQLLSQVKAVDEDCSPEFGSICRYELVPVAQTQPSVPSSNANANMNPSSVAAAPSLQTNEPQQQLADRLLSIDSLGRIWIERASAEFSALASAVGSARQRSFQVIAYDCGGKKSLRPALVHLNFSRVCKPALKGVSTRMNYQPNSGEQSPFLRAQFDLCGYKCHRANISVALQLEAPSGSSRRGLEQQLSHQQEGTVFNCDRDTYSMVSKRRLCGIRSRMMELLPPYGPLNRWVHPLTTASGASPLASDGPPTGDDSIGGATDQDEENLGAYSVEGSYGRQSLRWFASATGSGNEQLDEHAGSSTGDSSSSRKSRTGNQQHVQRSRLGRRRQPRESLSVQTKRSRPDPNAVYRDQVYRFDGVTTAALVPRTLYLSSTQQQQHTNHSVASGWHEFLFGASHTLSFWMQHEPFRFTPTNESSSSVSSTELEELSKHAKENLLCATLEHSVPQSEVPADVGDPMSQKPLRHNYNNHGRSYYSVFIHNCKLVLLMRRLSKRNSGSKNNNASYLPFEWRWSLDANKVCDKNWHLYTINVNYPNIELFIDGQQFEENDENLVIVDDLPLDIFSAPTRNGFATQQQRQKPFGEGQDLMEEADVSSASGALSVGACWDGRRRAWTGHFRGALSGLVVSSHQSDDSRTIECIGSCTEALVSTASSGGLPQQDQQPVTSEKIQPATASEQMRSKPDNSLVAYQESQSRILLQGHDVFDVEDALAQVAYVNRRSLPSIGRRTILVETNIECASASMSDQTAQQAQSYKLNQVKIDLDVTPSRKLPVIFISGAPNLAREYAAFQHGINLFSSIQLRVKKINLFGPPLINSVYNHAHGLHSKPTSSNAPHYLLQPTTISNIRQQNHNPASTLIHQHPTATASSSGNFSTSSQQEIDYIDDSVPGSDQQTTIDSQITDKREDLANVKRRIEACTVQVYPPLNSLHESLHLPQSQLDDLQLYWRQSHEGLMIYGLDSVQNYERLLRQIVYKNQRPAYYLERTFKLLCSDLNGRLVSNDYLRTLTIIHPQLQLQIPQPNSLKIVMSSSVHNNSWEKTAAALRSTELPTLDAAFSDQQQRQVGVVQSSHMDRIAMAFLVFVVSLVVMILVIALTNLKDPSVAAPIDERKLANRTKRQHSAIETCDSYRCACFAHGYSCSDGVTDEERYRNVDDEDDIGTKCAKHSNCFQARQRYANNFYDQEHALAWDEGEELVDDEEYDEYDNYECDKAGMVVVMNPLIHGGSVDPTTKAVKELVSEQKPDKSGSMSQRPRSVITWNASSQMITSPSENEHTYHDEESIQNHLDKRLRSTGCGIYELDATVVELEKPSRNVELVSTSCCSSFESASSTESSSSSSSCSDVDDDDDDDNDDQVAIRNKLGMPTGRCRFHESNFVQWYENSDENEWSTKTAIGSHYEIHHFHHTCLRRRLHHQCLPTMSPAVSHFRPSSDSIHSSSCSSFGAALTAASHSDQASEGPTSCTITEALSSDNSMAPSPIKSICK